MRDELRALRAIDGLFPSLHSEFGSQRCPVAYAATGASSTQPSRVGSHTLPSWRRCSQRAAFWRSCGLVILIVVGGIVMRYCSSRNGHRYRLLLTRTAEPLQAQPVLSDVGLAGMVRSASTACYRLQALTRNIQLPLTLRATLAPALFRFEFRLIVLIITFDCRCAGITCRTPSGGRYSSAFCSLLSKATATCCGCGCGV